MKGSKGVSGKTHTKQQVDHYANQRNPNSAAHKAVLDNRSVQKQGGRK